MVQIRVLLVDDHEIVRVGLRAVLELEEDLVVVGEAGEADAALRQAVALHPDVVVMDVRLGGTDGISACRDIRSQSPRTAVLILTSFGTEEAVMAALVAGASGFLLKNSGRADLLRAIRAVAAGESLLDPAVTRKVTERLVALAAKEEPEGIAELSPREREVLACVARGETNRQIAERLVISEATARNHVSHILEKLGMARRSEAAAFAARRGIGGKAGEER
ncbi:MAG: response regulator [Tepidiformaceae bacterium]